MAGILNSKERFFDTYITQEGKRQIAEGELRFTFVSFTDSATFYEKDSSNPLAAEDATGRIFFEAANRPQDSIIPEFRQAGFLDFPAGPYQLVGTQVVEVSSSAGKILNGAPLVDAASTVMNDGLTSFQDQQIIGSQEMLAHTTGFAVNNNKFSFLKGNNSPIPLTKPQVVSLSNVESLWQDMRTSHLPQFQYMPPINKESRIALGEFPQLQQPAPRTWAQLLYIMGVNESTETSGLGEPLSARFVRTSKSNNIVGQMFEVTSGSLEKLSLIDYGEFQDDDPDSPGKRVYFAGKVFEDDDGEETFFNLFTIIFD